VPTFLLWFISSARFASCKSFSSALYIPVDFSLKAQHD